MRTLFKSLVFMLMANLTFAQFFVGVRGGLTGSTMTKFKLIEKITPDFKLLSAPSGAIFVELPISNRISIQPELALTQKGFVINESFNVGGGDNLLGLNIPIGGRIALKNNHIEMPILAKFKLGDSNVGHTYIILDHQ